MSIKNKIKRLIFYYKFGIVKKLDMQSGEFQIRLRAENEKSISKARLCKNGT